MPKSGPELQPLVTAGAGLVTTEAVTQQKPRQPLPTGARPRRTNHVAGKTRGLFDLRSISDIQRDINRSKKIVLLKCLTGQEFVRWTIS